MEMTQSAPQLSSVDVESVSGKLHDMAHDLPNQEQAILGWMLQRAESCNQDDLNAAAAIADDFTGPTRPMPMQLADSVGIGSTVDDIDVTVEVRWTYRF